MPEEHSSHTGHPSEHLATAHIDLTNLFCVCCAESVEAALPANPHIERARVDFQKNTADVIVATNAVLLKRVEGDLREAK